MSDQAAPYKRYPAVVPHITDWPIYKLSEDREAFVDEINRFTLQRLMNSSPEQLNDLIAKTIYLERIRIKEEPWKVDPPNEGLFWKRIRKELVRHSLDRDDEQAQASTRQILHKIVSRYSEEIVGTFKISTFLFARRFLTIFFNRLLNTAASRNFKRIWGRQHQVYERLNVCGELDAIRSLIHKGTVVVVPTHSSNLDSIVIGFAMDAMLGLPSFSYGAGLNLYNTGYTAYYMNRLGAYRVDRRKKNPIYLETLKAMSNLSLRRGTNSLFFPGGTRSRSGALETRLKLGLLGTAVEAQRANCQQGGRKIFVVPLILSYHVVLEAKDLIEQYLKRTGKEFYIDASYSRRKILKFVWKIFSQSSDITLSFGKPMDVLGNFVDMDGNSFDRHGQLINIRDYFVSNGALTEDLQREGEYTKLLAERIVERYHRENIVLSSHLLACAVFNVLQYQNPRLDLYGLLRLPADEYIFPIETVRNAVTELKEHLQGMERDERIKLSPEIGWETDKLIADGVKNLGSFHAEKPLRFNTRGDLVSQDFKLLFYYHNRLDNYQLEKAIAWGQFEMAEVE